MVGWIKLHRQIFDSEIWNDDEPFDCRSAWVDLLLQANHEERNVKVGMTIIKVERGQKFTSISKLADRWHWSRHKVERYLKMLEDAKMVTTIRTSVGTLLSIDNYGIYQDCTDAIGTTIGTSMETRAAYKQEIKKEKKIRKRTETKIHNFSERKVDYDQLERRLTNEG